MTYYNLDLLHYCVDVQDSVVASTDDGLVFKDDDLGLKCLTHVARR